MSGWSAALAVYLALSRLAAPLAAPLLRRRLARGKEDADRLGERLGRPGLPRPAGRLVWMHGASIGEAMSLVPLINAFGDTQILLTTGTVTSARRIAPLLPATARHQFVPVDTQPAVTRFLDHWRPDLAIWVESELWPRLIVESAARRIPMALVNARLSADSAARWARLPAMARRLLGAFALIEAQDRETVERLARLGIAASFTGNLKALVPPPACDRAALDALQVAVAGRPVWLAASTHPGEEERVIAAQSEAAGTLPGLLCILAPRHPERADEIAALLTAAGMRFVRRSAGEVPGPGTEVLLADTLGEMGLWYRLAPVTFVGGSLVPRGGHTPFEPIALGSAVLHGPETANFSQAYRALDAAGGAHLVREDLGRQVAWLAADAEARGEMASEAIAARRGLGPDPAALVARLTALMDPA